MTTWTRDQVQQVRRLRASAQVDQSVIERSDGAVSTVAREKMVKNLIAMAQPFAVEPHPADFRFGEQRVEDDPRDLVEIRCWWEPQTNEVEFRGGERDGEVLAVRDAPWNPVLVQPSSPIVWSEPFDEPVALPEAVVYEMVGWRESERRWVYAAEVPA